MSLGPHGWAKPHRECVSDGLESFGCPGSLVLVRMELERQLPVRLLQLRVAGVLRHAQDFVVVVTFAYPAKCQFLV